MVSVERTPEPASLAANAETWTRELVEQIRLSGQFSKVPERFKNRYNQNDVKSALEQMYGEKCCYCEGQIGTCSYPHIEHRKPKSLYPALAFAWTNLHWGCQICNSSKGDKWNDTAPILDPSVDDIDEHLDFDLDTCMIVAKNNSPRAVTTIQHANLNRHKLVEARKRLKIRVTNLLLQAQTTELPEIRAFYEEELRRLHMNDPANGHIAQHSMFLKKLISNLGL